jgi:hypothetical protein
MNAYKSNSTRYLSIILQFPLWCKASLCGVKQVFVVGGINQSIHSIHPQSRKRDNRKNARIESNCVVSDAGPIFEVVERWFAHGILLSDMRHLNELGIHT